MITASAKTEWRAVLDRALAFADAAPWRWMDDGQVVGLVHPGLGERAYCSIIGRESELKALAVYVGKEGWWSYQQLSQVNAEADEEELVYEESCLLVSFSTPQSAEADDWALLRHVGIPTDGLAWVPSFRAYKPGLVPSVPAGTDLDWLGLALEQALAAAMAASAGEVHIPEEGLDKQGRLLFMALQPEGWAPQWLVADPKMDLSPPMATLTPDRALAGRALPQGEEIWLLDAFFLPQSVEDEDGGPAFFPKALVAFDVEDQAIKGLALLHPGQWPAAVADAVLDLILGHGRRPGQLVVSRAPQMILMRPFCKALDIGIHLEKQMDIRSELREAVMEAAGIQP